MDKRPWRLILLVLPSLGIYISHGWVEANGCGVCMPISLEPGVGIQLTIPPFPSLAGCTCCLTLTPDSGLLHFLSSWAQWTPVVTVIEGSQIFRDQSAPSSCSYWSSCRVKKCTKSFMFYISAPLNSWPTLQALEGRLMKRCAFCDSANVAVRLFYSVKDRWHPTRTHFKQCPLCHIADISTKLGFQSWFAALEQGHVVELL